MTTGLVLMFNAAVPLLLLLLTWLMPSLITPALPFGVRVPAARAEAPVVVEQRRVYRRRVAAGGGALVLAGVVLSFAAPGIPTGLPVSLAVGGVSTAEYVRARRAIRAVKQREGWYQGLRQAVAVDTSLRTDPERFPWLWTVPALLVIAGTAVTGVLGYPSMPDRLPMHYGGSGTVDDLAAKSVSTAFTPVFVQLAVTTMLLLVLRLTFRSRADLDPARPAVTAWRHRRFIVRMTISVLLLTACVDATAFLAAWATWHGHRTISPLALLTPTLVGLAVVTGVSVRTGQNGSRLTVPEGDSGDDTALVHQDDDRYWRAGGTVYANRHDRSVFVPKRFGIGWTVNFGNPRSLLFPVLIAAFMLVMALIRH